jgi:ubiquinone/menaquinone biosynthesis C-methylase UbiE
MKSGVRIADEGIYLQENRYKEPKEQFKQIYSFLDLGNVREDASLCDVGCATGEFLYFVHQNKPRMRLSGVDVSEAMIERAKGELPSAEFYCGSVDEPGSLRANTYDLVTLIGVIGIFDDVTTALNNCINAVLPGGKVLVFASFNPYPIDLITRYRRANQDNAPWELGWNVHSQATVERIAKKHTKVQSLAFRDFTIPFAIAPKDDPMRCWTMRVGDNEHYHTNGALQLVNMQMLLVQCK